MKHFLMRICTFQPPSNTAAAGLVMPSAVSATYAKTTSAKLISTQEFKVFKLKT